MRIPINLSSEPFRRDRPILVASAACSVVLVVLLAVLIFLIRSDRSRVEETRVSIDKLSAQLRTIAVDQAKYDAVLRQPANAEVLQRSVLLNALLQRKSISWTRIFADLEKVLPPNVRLISVRLPQITSQNEVLLDMQVGAASPEPALDFMRRLEKSPLFGPLSLQSQLPPSQNDPLYRFRITVNYAQKL